MARFELFIDRQSMGHRSGGSYIYRPMLRVQAAPHCGTETVILSAPFSHDKDKVEQDLRKAAQELRDCCQEFLDQA